jgi:hypothetical protein
LNQKFAEQSDRVAFVAAGLPIWLKGRNLMKLYLIRHAPTHRKSMVGWSDVDADFSGTASL